MAELVIVKVRDCECPNHPHNGEGDWVALAPTLSLDGGMAAEQDIRDAAQIEDLIERGNAIQRRLVSTFVRHGAKAWNLLDEEGEPVPFDVDAILADYAIARPVAERADSLYQETLLRPFRYLLATRSPTGQTGATTSSTRRRTRKQSERSSPDTSAASAP